MLRSLLLGVQRRTNTAFSVGLAGFVIGLAYLILKVQSVKGVVGYDFRFLWVAAKMWSVGADPYSEAFFGFMQDTNPTGPPPSSFFYPPTWWPLSIVLPTDDILLANWAFNFSCIVMLLISVMIVGNATARLWGERAGIASVPWRIVFFVQGVAFLALAATETTAIHLSSGQTTAVVVLGGALLLLGFHDHKAIWRIVGLVLLLLKPQIGLPYAAAYLANAPRRALRDLVPAGFITSLLAVPAIFNDPLALREFVTNASSYQGASIANHPAAMTGLRSAVHALSGLEIGNFVPLVVSCLLAMLLGIYLLEKGRRADARLLVPLTTVVVLAIGSLHYYDFTLLILSIPLLATLSAPRCLVFLSGYALIFRADSLGTAIGFYDHDVGIFEGSWLSTIGALLMLAAALRPERSVLASAE